MRLFLDDDINRHLAFARRYPGEMQTCSPIVAQQELNTTPGHITELWLDHDLGERFVNGGFFNDAGEAVGTQTDTVMPLVDWMCTSHVVDRALHITIHSWNAPAAMRMKLVLEAAGFTNVKRAAFSFPGLAEGWGS